MCRFVGFTECSAGHETPDSVKLTLVVPERQNTTANYTRGNNWERRKGNYKIKVSSHMYNGAMMMYSERSTRPWRVIFYLGSFYPPSLCWSFSFLQECCQCMRVKKHDGNHNLSSATRKNSFDHLRRCRWHRSHHLLRCQVGIPSPSLHVYIAGYLSDLFGSIATQSATRSFESGRLVFSHNMSVVHTLHHWWMNSRFALCKCQP